MHIDIYCFISSHIFYYHILNLLLSCGEVKRIVRFLNDDAIEIEGIEYRRVRPRIEVPDWASIEFNVQSWWELLEDHNIDKTARYNLFMLAQTNQDGAR